MAIGRISPLEEFLYPDDPLQELPGSLRLATARNAPASFQLLLRVQEGPLSLAFTGEEFDWECFALRDVPVEYNTGNGVEQGGAMVLMQPPEQPLDYVTRQAPFRVYDCLEPLHPEAVPVVNDLAALYLCIHPRDARPGEHRLQLVASAGAERYKLEIQLRVYDVRVPENTFPVTNWFSLQAMSRFHQVPMDSPAFLDVVGAYARAMRRMHQTAFFLRLDRRCLVSRAPYRFDFSHMEPLIRRFLSEGLTTLETGPLLSRGYRPDGSPDMFAARFTCALCPDIPFDSPEGFELTASLLKSFADFLRQHGWDKQLLFHIHDEPDIHVASDEDLQHRRREYGLAVSMLKQRLPHAQVIEAVGSAAFRGLVDIMVPGTAGYEANQQAFDLLIRLGDQVWSYVCCGPQGQWLNRFLDFALLKGRLLFWGFAANGISGYLHWGLNQFREGMNPFERTSCPNDTGLGTDFPCGDAFIVYPGTDGPWPSMRGEAARRGAEDAALLLMLKERDPGLHGQLIARVFRSNQDYCREESAFAQVHEALLSAIEAQPGG